MHLIQWIYTLNKEKKLDQNSAANFVSVSRLNDFLKNQHLFCKTLEKRWVTECFESHFCYRKQNTSTVSFAIYSWIFRIILRYVGLIHPKGGGQSGTVEKKRRKKFK